MPSPTDLSRRRAIAPTQGFAAAERPALGGGHRYPAANSLVTAMALSACAGFLDGFTYVGHGHVFASAMTGNMVLLGIHIATDRNLLTLLPLLAYVAGVVLAHVLLRETPRRIFRYRPHIVTLSVEVVVLTSLALFPHTLDDDLLVPIITIATAMQNTTFRNIGTRTYNSVIMTGNLQSFANAIAAGVSPRTPAKLVEAAELFGIIASFVAGAAFGAAFAVPLGLRALLCPATMLGIGCFVLLLSRDGE